MCYFLTDDDGIHCLVIFVTINVVSYSNQLEENIRAINVFKIYYGNEVSIFIIVFSNSKNILKTLIDLKFLQVF